MQLLTDYQQFYDGIFDGRPPVFHRMAFTRGGLDKPAQFRLFAALGLPAPPHGTVTELQERFRRPGTPFAWPEAVARDVWCVVYTDELAHRGEGKMLVPLSEAAKRHPACFASLFVAPAGEPVAFRHVRFGGLAYWLRQSGARAGWQSNRADQEQVLSKCRVAGPNPVPRVLWAIDFIPSPNGLLAVDFNTAPDLTTLGEASALTNAEVQAELELAAGEDPRQLAQF
jgi:hypothetical protein